MSPVCPFLSPAFGGSERGQKGQMPLGISPCPFPAMGLLADLSGNLRNAGSPTGPSRECAAGGRGAPTFFPPQEIWKSGIRLWEALGTFPPDVTTEGETPWNN